MHPLFYYLAFLVLLIVILIVPTAIYERYQRSDYRAFVRHQRALEAQRALYVPIDRTIERPKLRVVRQGQVRP